MSAMLGSNGGAVVAVVADETFVGGSLKNKSNAGRKRTPEGVRPSPCENQVAVLSLVDVATGEVRSE